MEWRQKVIVGIFKVKSRSRVLVKRIVAASSTGFDLGFMWVDSVTLCSVRQLVVVVMLLSSPVHTLSDAS